eukprot:CAMPEP_0206471496 /NCGR_PEP_ID=MMETSP0324_2-20121206/31600_1 /ASSEMBLY_ACC=CAM_ASM_000836 /TAXON_ID=2866 /ORGANISM="Crypthecodinium cohnii, Strain Seligo" /LENGTH=114 /DNA_ID=CAMNT_0053945837 /DNA_START=114 /DNA_END=458 /DNA_ORIENTATION=-
MQLIEGLEATYLHEPRRFIEPNRRVVVRYDVQVYRFDEWHVPVDVLHGPLQQLLRQPPATEAVHDAEGEDVGEPAVWSRYAARRLPAKSVAVGAQNDSDVFRVEIAAGAHRDHA